MFIKLRGLGWGDSINKVKTSTNRYKNITNNQTEICELKNTLTELKFLLEVLNSTLDNKEKQSVNLKRGHLKLSSQRCNKEKKILKKSEESLRDLWDTIKWTSICIMEVMEGE